MKSRKMIEEFQIKVRKGKPSPEEKKALQEKGISPKEYRKNIIQKST